ncbi:hypothetical protein GGX14DRAFT_393053 [Mycena pura]|uniref:Uncharacterized protein n=1 Tax=Mycena pura TaxID=153505 RepID=A0AAD6VI18_9AGAR|nr:hypothetical protein GGX14DRAFT_393053 [Mycena pura]
MSPSTTSTRKCSRGFDAGGGLTGASRARYDLGRGVDVVRMRLNSNVNGGELRMVCGILLFSDKQEVLQTTHLVRGSEVVGLIPSVPGPLKRPDPWHQDQILPGHRPGPPFRGSGPFAQAALSVTRAAAHNRVYMRSWRTDTSSRWAAFDFLDLRGMGGADRRQAPWDDELFPDTETSIGTRMAGGAESASGDARRRALAALDKMPEIDEHDDGDQGGDQSGSGERNGGGSERNGEQNGDGSDSEQNSDGA